MCDIVTNHWEMYFDTLMPLETLPRLLNVCESTIHSSLYRWNARRFQTSCEDSPVIFQYTLEGKGIFETGTESHELLPGMGFLIPSDDRNYCYYQPAGIENTQRVLWCNLKSEASCEMAREINRRFGYVFRIPRTTGVIARLRSYRSGEARRRTLSSVENAGLASELLYQLIRSREQAEPSTSDKALLEETLRFIGSREDYVLSVSELAEAVHVSREHLSRVFKKEMGVGPHQYMIQIKLEKAGDLLKTTARPVKDIAWSLGFTSPVHFSNLYRKWSGVSPRDYRNSCRILQQCKD